MENTNHNIDINRRKNITVIASEGVAPRYSLPAINNMGYLKINGSQLEIIKLDTNKGDISIKGKIDSLNYLDSNKNKESIISKLFK